jgi:hypothetical protein
MQAQYTRMMLAQMLLIFLVILWVAGGIKTHVEGLSPPPPMFPVLVRNYGFLLLIVPAAWCIWATVQSRRPTHGLQGEVIIGVSGVAICLLIILLGWFAFRVAFWAPPVVFVGPNR